MVFPFLLQEQTQSPHSNPQPFRCTRREVSVGPRHRRRTSLRLFRCARPGTVEEPPQSPHSNPQPFRCTRRRESEAPRRSRHSSRRLFHCPPTRRSFLCSCLQRRRSNSRSEVVVGRCTTPPVSTSTAGLTAMHFR